MSALFAATYPDRTSALLMYGSYARRQRASDYPWGQSEDNLAASLREIEEGWGGPVGRAIRAPTAAHDERFMRFWASYLVQSASPRAALSLARMNAEIDIRPILSAIRVPTLILHREGDRVVRIEDARYLAEQIPSAELVLLAGDDHLPWVGDQDAVLDEIEECLTGIRRGPSAGSGIGDGPVHRHRRFDQEGRRARRRAMEGVAPRARRARPHRADPLPRGRGEDHRRRFPGELRRAGPGGGLCARDRGRGAAPGDRGPSGLSHRGGRAARGRSRRDRCAHRRPGRGARRRRGGARVQHGEGPRRRVRADVRRPRPAPAEGRSR